MIPCLKRESCTGGSRVSSDALQELQEVLSALTSLLSAERERNRFPWIARAHELAAYAADCPEALIELKSFIRRLPSGAGTFCDLVLWSDDFDERRQINEKLETLRGRVTELAEQL